jgi:hypothetical protein
MKVQNQADICVKQIVWGVRKARVRNNLEPENTSDGLSKTSQSDTGGAQGEAFSDI